VQIRGSGSGERRHANGSRDPDGGVDIGDLTITYTIHAIHRHTWA
jgi:hypothetical protein